MTIWDVQDKVVNRLKAEKIPFILYGGTTILGKRAVSIDDIDILVKLDDWESGRVDKVMYDMGSPNYIAFVFEKKFKLNDIPIEVKWQTHPIICRNVREIWEQRSREIKVNGVKVKTFSKELSVVFMCVHTYKHIVSGTHKERNLFDLKYYIEENNVDLDYVLDYAKVHQREEIVKSILALVRDYCGLEISADFKHDYTRQQILYPKRCSMPVDKLTLEYLEPKDRVWYREILKYPDPRLYPRITGYGGVI